MFAGLTLSGISGNLEMSGDSAKVGKKSRERPDVRERSGNLCSQGNLIVAAQPNAGNQNVVEIRSQLYGHVLRSSYNLPVLCVL